MKTLFRHLSMMWWVWASIFVGLMIASATSAREVDNTVHAAVTCANTSTTALALNGGRVSALFVNDSTQTIWIAINQTAVANEGIRLSANGGSYYITNSDGNLNREAVNCIVASGTGIILVTEWFN